MTGDPSEIWIIYLSNSVMLSLHQRILYHLHFEISYYAQLVASPLEYNKHPNL
jgi:hypothetical protein